jgi:hypothetical protein
MRSLETHPNVRRLLPRMMSVATEGPVVSSSSPSSLWLGCCGERDTEAAGERQTPNTRCNTTMNKKIGSILSSGCTPDIHCDFTRLSHGELTAPSVHSVAGVVAAGRRETHWGS